jgi:iron-sulfur cluster assembly accessory protein
VRPASQAGNTCYKLGADRALVAFGYDPTVQISERPTETLLSLTPTAAAKIRELMAEEPDGDTMVLRVAIQGGGCSGFQYGLGFDTQAAEGDHELVLEGVNVVVDPFSVPYLQGATIDFLTGLQESGFKIDNPNASSSCGCGHSFQVEEGEELPEGTQAGGCGSGCSH